MKFGLMIASLSLFFSVTSNAGVFGIHSIKKIIQENTSKSIKSDDSSTQSCANFAGTWKGICKDNEGVSEEIEWNITQSGCESLTLDGSDSFTFGGVKTTTESKKTESSTTVQQIDFGKKGNNATIVWNGHGRSLEINGFWQISGKADLVLESETKLVTQSDFNFKTFILETEVKNSIHKNDCEFSKVK